MRNRLLLGVIVAMLVSACAAAVAEAFPKPCICAVSDERRQPVTAAVTERTNHGED